MGSASGLAPRSRASPWVPLTTPRATSPAGEPDSSRASVGRPSASTVAARRGATRWAAVTAP